MTFTATKAREMECVLCSSILDEPTATLGPNVCVALAYAPEFWESPEAAQVALGINSAISHRRPTHRVVVGMLMDQEYREWLKHPDFNSGMPLSCVEHAIKDLITRYHHKRIVATIARAYEKLIDKPELAREVGFDLKLKLEGVL